MFMSLAVLGYPRPLSAEYLDGSLAMESSGDWTGLYGRWGNKCDQNFGVAREQHRAFLFMLSSKSACPPSCKQ
jgi:hypothetical protein